MGAIHSIKIQTGPTGKSGPPQKVDQFFSVGPNRSIEFWAEIPGNFGWMDRAQCLFILSFISIIYSFFSVIYIYTFDFIWVLLQYCQ